MGEQATGAILNSLFCIGKIATALITKSIQRAIAEQAVEIVRVLRFMTRKVFAVTILKKSIIRQIAHSKLNIEKT